VAEGAVCEPVAVMEDASGRTNDFCSVGVRRPGFVISPDEPWPAGGPPAAAPEGPALADAMEAALFLRECGLPELLPSERLCSKGLRSGWEDAFGVTSPASLFEDQKPSMAGWE